MQQHQHPASPKKKKVQLRAPPSQTSSLSSTSSSSSSSISSAWFDLDKRHCCCCVRLPEGAVLVKKITRFPLKIIVVTFFSLNSTPGRPVRPVPAHRFAGGPVRPRRRLLAVDARAGEGVRHRRRRCGVGGGGRGHGGACGGDRRQRDAG